MFSPNQNIEINPLGTKAQGTLRKEKAGEKMEEGTDGEDCCEMLFLDRTWLLQPCSHSSCSYLDETYMKSKRLTSQCGWSRKPPVPAPY